MFVPLSMFLPKPEVIIVCFSLSPSEKVRPWSPCVLCKPLPTPPVLGSQMQSVHMLELSWLCSRHCTLGYSLRYYFKTPYLGIIFIFFSLQCPYFFIFLFPRYISYLSSDLLTKIHSEFRFPGVMNVFSVSDWETFNSGFCLH